MGSESRCTVHFGRQRSEGKALLETDELIFRGEFRLAIPRKAITEVDATDGTLRVTFPDGTARFELGPIAAKWADKIKNPPSLLDKLGVKPGLRVSVVGIEDRRFLDDLAARVDDLTRGRAKAGSDLVLVAMSDRAELPRLAKLREAIKATGAIWVVWPKGRKEFREDDVRDFGKTAGLVDVKVARFSETLSALKMMIPRAQR